MDLFEFEGKRLLKEAGISVPMNAMVYAAEDNAPLLFPFMLKAQVLTGGRGKAGGIHTCNNAHDYARHVKNMLGMDIKGHTVYGLMAEEMYNADHELYLSISLNGSSGKPLLMVSPMGGMEIERIAKEQPDALLKMEIDPFAGIHDYQYKALAGFLPMADANEIQSVVGKLYMMMTKINATLMEINPLGVVGGKVTALDAKVVLDDNAVRLNAHIVENISEGRGKLEGYSKPESENNTITFMALEGDVGLISDGAGTGMLTLDLISDAQGRVASFCELGGITNEETMHRAMEKTFFQGNTVKSLLIVLIGGFNRMDDMANGIVRYMNEHGTGVPVFTRMCGTMEEEGKRIMKEYGLETYDDLVDAVTSSVKAAKVG